MLQYFSMRFFLESDNGTSFIHVLYRTVLIFDNRCMAKCFLKNIPVDHKYSPSHCKITITRNNNPFFEKFEKSIVPLLS